MISIAYILIAVRLGDFGKFLGNKHWRTKAFKREFKPVAALSNLSAPLRPLFGV
jgi:hypothetical protein